MVQQLTWHVRAARKASFQFDLGLANGIGKAPDFPNKGFREGLHFDG